MNQERALVGESALTLDPDFIDLAQYHAEQMCRHEFFSHTDQDGRGLADRAAEFSIPYTSIGENIATRTLGSSTLS